VAGPLFWHGGRCFLARRGKWAFYVGRLRLKLLFAHDGRVDCLHRSRPDRTALFAGRLDRVDFGRYSAADWKAALSKDVRRRAVENFIASRRLFLAGLGPEPYGLCFLKQFYRDLSPATPTAGILIQNVDELPPRPPVTRGEMIDCGVMPDRIESSLRQQLRGYVIDLNSVCGVMPLDAEGEIEQMAGELSRRIDQAAL
jgi:hypothetical protein